MTTTATTHDELATPKSYRPLAVLRTAHHHDSDSSPNGRNVFRSDTYSSADNIGVQNDKVVASRHVVELESR